MELATKTKTSGEEDEMKKHVQLVDIPGHFNFQSVLLEKLDQAKSVIMMVDSKDKNTFRDAATTLYEVLNNVDALSDGLPLLVACNK